MIGKLKGVIDEIAEDHAVIDVHGVGYVAFVRPVHLVILAGQGKRLFCLSKPMCART